MGDKLQKSFSERFHLKQPNHPLKEKLEEVECKMEEVTHVILTHLHFDHAGGATTFDFEEVPWKAARAAKAFKVSVEEVNEALAALTSKVPHNIYVHYDDGAIRISAER